MSVFLLSVLLLSGASHAGNDMFKAQLGPPSIAFRSSARSVCRPIPSTLSLCQGIGYRRMWIPNLLGHESLREAQQQSAAWLPLVSKLCHRDTKKFLCSLFTPVCLTELSGPVSPCRGLCEAVRDGCVPVMSAFGFPWPEMFNCSRFPSGSELCIPDSEEQERQAAEKGAAAAAGEEDRHEKEPKGNLICDACNLAAEGEADIRQQFCHSSYALKMRMESMSTVGGDRQLVPTARSRILRWAGGGAERAQFSGGAGGLHSALWLPGGSTCICPGLDAAETNQEGLGGELIHQKPPKDEGRAGGQGGWFITLAQAEEGRLVVTHLVRWSRGDKELKKFIRALLKLSCLEL